MKNSRMCPKCNARNIIRVPGAGKGYTALPMGFESITRVRLVRYVCGVCGYSEEWIDDADDLRKLKEKFG